MQVLIDKICLLSKWDREILLNSEIIDQKKGLKIHKIGKNMKYFLQLCTHIETFGKFEVS